MYNWIYGVAIVHQCLDRSSGLKTPFPCLELYASPRLWDTKYTQLQLDPRAMMLLRNDAEVLSIYLSRPDSPVGVIFMDLYFNPFWLKEFSCERSIDTGDRF